MSVPRLAAATLAVIACAALAAADGEPAKDRVLLREGRPLEVTVESETQDKLVYRTAAGTQPLEKRSREVVGVIYAGMGDGAWKEGETARAAGDFAQAATSFGLVANGEREWQKVYGTLAVGDCLEQAGQPVEAAAEFAKVVKDFPKHRLWIDACYRQGMALAVAKKDAEALKLGDELAEFGKKTNNSAAEARCAAVRAAAACIKSGTKDAKFRDQLRRANMRPGEDFAVWYHFNLWLAETFLAAGESRDLQRTVDAMLPALDGDADRRARIQFIKGMSLVESDPQGAIVELLRLDCLPVGTAARLAEARATAGRLLVDQAKALRAEKDERKLAIAQELEATARLVLTAAANGPGDHPAKAQAKALLATIEIPKPAAPAAPAAAGAKPAAAASGAKAK